MAPKATKLLFLFYFSFSYLITCHEATFIASFQTEITGSYSAVSDVWMESSKKIPSLKEFTVCNWIKIKFYNIKTAACLWSYCTVQTNEDEMECLQVCLGSIDGTLGRNVFIAGYIPLEAYSTVSKALTSYRHRTWTHLCWSFSAVTGTSEFFHDGFPLGKHYLNVSNSDVAIKGFEKMSTTALIFGQEPDMIRGEFDSLEAYLGELSELNIWSYVLTISNIKDMASCKILLKGDVLAWDKTNWNTTNVLIQDFSDQNLFCQRKRQYFLIPYKLRYPEAKKTCEIHGGHLAIPKSEEDIIAEQKEAAALAERIAAMTVHEKRRYEL